MCITAILLYLNVSDDKNSHLYKCQFCSIYTKDFILNDCAYAKTDEDLHVTFVQSFVSYRVIFLQNYNI